jgi:hypothetical protein
MQWARGKVARPARQATVAQGYQAYATLGAVVLSARGRTGGCRLAPGVRVRRN